MKSSILIALVATIFIGLFGFQTGRTVEAQRTRNLFELRTTPQARPDAEKSSIASVRESEIEVGNLSIDANRVRKQRFPLFDGKIYEAVMSNFEERGQSDFTWRGKIVEGKAENDVILTFRNGYISGLIYTSGSVYEILPRGDKHILIELDQSRFPECAGEVKDEMIASDRAISGPFPVADSGDRIDVLVVYTTATKNFLGGDAQAQAFSQQAIDAANTAYMNSKIRQRVRMVFSQEYLFTETGVSSTDLATLRNNPTIQAARSSRKADLVAMIGEVSDVCGIGYLVGTANGQASGYSITARSCAVGNMSFAHEMGHNMGSHHNPENAGPAIFPYSYGHYVNGQFRTVMSYVNQCALGCTRRPYFSNPAVFYNGLPTGITGSRDNALSLDNTADNVANYNYSGSSLTLTTFNGADVIPRNISRAVTWTSDNLAGNVRIELSRDEGTSWETLVAATPNDGTQSVNVPGRATRRARLRIVSVDAPTVSDSSNRNISIR